MGYWTDKGFIAYQEDWYKEQIQQLFLEAFGEDFLLDDTLPQGILITRLAELLYNTDMDGIQAFSMLNINTASGVFLDLIGNMRGIPRGLGTPQVVTVTLTCNASNFTPFTIPQGQVFTLLNTDEVFTSIAGKSITSAVSTIELEYSDSGNSSASVGGKMQTTGLAQIQDIEITYMVDGQGRETDMEYRRRMQTTYPVANQTIEYVEGLIKQLQYVKTTGNNYNDTDEVVDTLPPYSTEWMVVPKDNTDMDMFKDKVATIICNNKMPGAPTAGNTTVDVVDIFGKPKTIKFTIPEAVPLQINVQVATPEATGILDLGGVPDIIKNITAYINGLNIGNDVSYSRCMAPLTADTGFDVIKFQIRTLPEGEEWSPSATYQTGDRVRYKGLYYTATADEPGTPTIDPSWVVYNEGWVDNANFPIDNRTYATITDDNVLIGV